MLSKYALHQNNFHFYTPVLDYDYVGQTGKQVPRPLPGWPLCHQQAAPVSPATVLV